jgi:DNA phosphorothioation-associated putative methyltransferase
MIERHRAAIRRGEPSLPLKCLLRDGLVSGCNSLFDFGCGHGEDIGYASSFGVDAHGWDPAFRPNGEKSAADIVNLSYVLNVIEDVQERAETLRKSWSLTQRVLTVAARIVVGGQGENDVEFGDGILTKIGTFQKFYTQAELREYIETVLEVEVLPAAPGVFYVFRDEELRQHYLATKYRRRSAAPRKRISEIQFEQHKEILEPLMDWVADRGRLPEPDELDGSDKILFEFGSLARAFALIRRVTDSDEWELAGKKRFEDLLVYLALAKFQKRPQFSKYPLDLQRDIRSFFGTFSRACELADALLFLAGDPDEIDAACRRAGVGRLVDNGLLIHCTALDELEPLLRIYEGCAQSWIGEIEGANIVKLHRFSGKVTYFVCPDFETAPHPVVVRRVKLSLRARDLYCVDYSQSDDPPLLHRKDEYVSPGHPFRDKFARLTKQEDRHELLNDFEETEVIRHQSQWELKLRENGFRLAGHRLVRKKSTE